MKAPILDVYDDLSGSVLTRLIPDRENIPRFIKEASRAGSESPDEDYALLLVSPGGEKKRKYACVDAGNTALSVLYFLEQKNTLPHEMRKVAAHNLALACRRHGMQPPVLLEKQAEGMEPEAEGFPAIVHFEESYLDEVPPERTARFKTASGVPLDTRGDVEAAIQYFQEEAPYIHPRERRGLALPIEKRASALSIQVPLDLTRYAGDSYAPDLQAQLEARKNLLGEEGELYSLLVKQASKMSPDVFAEALASLDTQTGLSDYWDGYVPDPYYTTFYKKAEGEFEYSDGADKVTGTDLQRLARNDYSLLCKQFPRDLVDGFVKNPIPIFKSLPQTQRKIIMRMAQDNNL